MNKYIYLNYYSSLDTRRKKELIYCVNKNLNLSFIKRIFCFIEKKEEIKDLLHLKNFKKITFVVTNKKRILAVDLFEHANKCLEKNSIAIFMSTDVFIEESSSWKNVHSNFFNRGYPHKLLIGIRKNLFPTLISKRQLDWEARSSKEGDYFDVLAFKIPLKKSLLKENFRFIWGTPNCDGLIMGLFGKHYHVFSWGNKYKSFHFDIERKKNENPKLTFNHIEIRENFEIGSLLRIDEAARVPQNQNWSVLLKKKNKPQVIYLKNPCEAIIKKIIRKIYYFIILNFIKILYRIIN